MKLFFKIFDAADKIKDATKLRLANNILESTSLTLTSLKTNRMELSNGLMKIKNVPVRDISKTLKVGNLTDYAKLVYNVDYVSPQMAQVLTKQVQNLPEFKMAKFDAKKDVLVKKLGDVPKTKLDVADLDSFPKLNTVLKYMTGKRFLTLTGGVIILGTSATYLISEINKHRERMAGCYMYTVEGGKLKSCKIPQWSCKNGQPITESNAPICTYPTTSTKTCAEVSGFGCINCPPPDFQGDADIDNESSLDTLTEKDSTLFKCIDPSISDAIADIINDKIDDVEKLIRGSTEGVTDLFSTILKVLKYVAIALGIGAVIGVVIFAYQKFRSVSYETGGTNETGEVESRVL